MMVCNQANICDGTCVYLASIHFSGISIVSSESNSDDFINQIASMQLPPSLFRVVNTSIVGLVSTVYENSILFPLANGSRPNTEIRTSVIGVLLSGVPALRDLPDPVEINLLLTTGSVSIYMSKLKLV